MSQPIASLTNPKDRWQFLDALRGVAAMAVVVQHGLETCVNGYLAWSIRWFDMGQLGVVLFLLISGYIIPESLERSGSNKRFWLNRLFRLFPLYWATIALFAVFYAVQGGGFQPPNLWQWLVNLTMLQEFVRVPHVTGVFWTLTLELIFYFSCSALFALGWLRRVGLFVVIGQVGLVVLGIAFPLIFERRFPAGYAVLIITMFVGTLFYRVTAGQLSKGRMAWIVMPLAPIALAVSYIAFSMFERNGHPMTFHCVYAVWILGYVVFCVTLAFRQCSMPGWICFLGRISYSVYLVHSCMLLVLPRHWSAPIYLGALVAGTVALSSVTYYLVELPGINLGRYLFPKTPTRSESQGSEQERVRAAA